MNIDLAESGVLGTSHQVLVQGSIGVLVGVVAQIVSKERLDGREVAEALETLDVLLGIWFVSPPLLFLLLYWCLRHHL